MPDAYESPSASALLDLGRTLAAARDASLPVDEETGLLVQRNLLWTSLVVGREAAQRGDIKHLLDVAGLGVAFVRKLAPEVVAAGDGEVDAAVVSDPAELARFEAEYRAVVAGRTADLGPRHPVTPATTAKLAELLIARQSWSDAAVVPGELADAYDEVDHPDTGNAREALDGVRTQEERR